MSTEKGIKLQNLSLHKAWNNSDGYSGSATFRDENSSIEVQLTADQGAAIVIMCGEAIMAAASLQLERFKQASIEVARPALEHKE